MLNIKEFFSNMKPFMRSRDGDFIVPSLPKLPKDDYETIVVPNMVRCGAIPKSELIVGRMYEGHCRNARYAVWTGSCFVYERNKFGNTYHEKINHFEDDNGFDLFIPIKLL